MSQQASGNFFRALEELRKAAEAELTGNAYYLAANQIADLFETIDPERGSAHSPSNHQTAGFESALAEVRQLTGKELEGNLFYRVSNKLDALSSLCSSVSEGVNPHRLAGTEPPPPSVRISGAGAAMPRRTFEDLAAAAKSRVDDVATSLGIPIRRSAAPFHMPSRDTLANGELERRSSEPCALAELAPPSLGPVAPAAVPAETDPLRGSSEAAHSVGSQAPKIERVFGDGANPASPPLEIRAKPAVQAAATADDTAAPPTRQKVEGEKAAGPRRKGQKTLFSLWLDMMFGRKD
jgi:hypothetical protein